MKASWEWGKDGRTSGEYTLLNEDLRVRNLPWQWLALEARDPSKELYAIITLVNMASLELEVMKMNK